MNHSYSLLIHKSFKELVNQVIRNYPKSQQQLITNQIKTALQKISSDPFSQKPLRDIIHRKLIGIIRRVYVGGNKGHRLFYICIQKESYVLPTFISKEIRQDFNYDDISWQNIANAIYDDYLNLRYEAFVNWKASQ